MSSKTDFKQFVCILWGSQTIVVYLLIASSFFADFVGSQYANTSYRRKRVVYGEEHLERSEYLSTEYFVWIGNGDECDIGFPIVIKQAFGLHLAYELSVPKLGFKCAASTNHLKCTGSLLTPLVVQTACHCLADYVTQSTSYVYRAAVYNVDERRFNIYPGKYTVQQMKNSVAAKRYLPHTMCQRYYNYVLYDYALIVLESPMSLTEMQLAPAYSVRDLAMMWVDLMSKGKMCLNIGYGVYLSKYAVEGQIFSPTLLHGWRPSVDYMTCYDRMRPEIYVEDGEDPYQKYKRLATFFCTQRIQQYNPNISRGAGQGDSGGPVSCDNEYMGIVSYTQDDVDANVAIAFTPWENSYQFREGLMRYLKFKNWMYSARDPKFPTYFPTYLPFNESSVHWKQRSGGVQHRGTVLCLLILVLLFV